MPSSSNRTCTRSAGPYILLHGADEKEFQDVQLTQYLSDLTRQLNALDEVRHR